jgi:trk system potassium uptake protein TrkH
MRLRLILGVLGVLLVFVGLAMLVPAAAALWFREEDLFAHLAGAGATVLLGLLLWLARERSPAEIRAREGFAIVTFGWVLSCLGGALPFYFYTQVTPPWFADAPALAAERGGAGEVPRAAADCARQEGIGLPFCSFTNCVFESFSGFTTTGATVLSDDLWEDESSRRGGLPHGLMLWRALTHWLGGMGIIVLGIAILPLLGVGGMELFKAEVPGPTADKLTPRVTQTAKLLWSTYALLSAAEAALLIGGGQRPFVAVCHTFATLATGGFSPLRDSVAGLHSSYAEMVITVFMLLAGMNFAWHYRFLIRRFAGVGQDAELIFFLTVALIATLVVGALLAYHGGGGSQEPLRYAMFQVASILTTTGFCTDDFGRWGVPAQMILFSLFFVGGCAGSTGGGIKCARIWVMIKQAATELFHLVHPRAVTKVRLAGTTVEGAVLRSVNSFVFLYLVLFLAGVVAMAMLGLDFVDSITSVGACIGNIGPGFGSVGAAENYEFIPTAGKWVLMGCMLLGRLEIYTVFVLFIPEYWRR